MYMYLPFTMEKKINAVNVLDFTTLNHRSSYPSVDSKQNNMRQFAQTHCIWCRQRWNGAVGTRGKWLLKDASPVKCIVVRVKENVIISIPLNWCNVSFSRSLSLRFFLKREREGYSFIWNNKNDISQNWYTFRFIKRIIYFLKIFYCGNILYHKISYIHPSLLFFLHTMNTKPVYVLLSQFTLNSLNSLLLSL